MTSDLSYERQGAGESSAKTVNAMDKTKSTLVVRTNFLFRCEYHAASDKTALWILQLQQN